MRRSVFIAFAVFGGIILLFLYLVLWMPNTFDGDKIVVVSKGENFKQVKDSLLKAGVIRNGFFFEIAGRILGSTKKLKVGRYRFKSGVSNGSIIDNLERGETVELITVSVPEGLRATTQAGIFKKELGIDSARFMHLVNSPAFSESLGVSGTNLMGYLMPKTYKFYWQTDEEEILRELVKEFWKEFNDDLKRQAIRRGMTINEIITLASIIELETAVDSERALIAGVYYNRLQRRMKLQADPTVQYAISGEPRRLRYSDLKIDSDYNTYKHYGLPPGPINNPGMASILAALYPARHRYLYFVATGLGGHRFSTDFKFHKEAAREYRRTRDEVKTAKESDGGG